MYHTSYITEQKNHNVNTTILTFSDCSECKRAHGSRLHASSGKSRIYQWRICVCGRGTLQVGFIFKGFMDSTAVVIFNEI